MTLDSPLATVLPAPPPLAPWQAVTLDSGLALHGALELACDSCALAGQFRGLDEDPTVRRTSFGSSDGSWTIMTLVECHRTGEGEGAPTELLARMPVLAGLLSRLPASVKGAHISRQSPGGILDWHFEPQSLCLGEARLLLPILVPQGALTYLGHQAVAYPAGRVWAGDFRFPHMVDNSTALQRIVVLIDVVTSEPLRRLAPPELTASPDLRRVLAEQAETALRIRGGEPRYERILTPARG